MENREKMGKAQWERFGSMDHSGAMMKDFRAAWRAIREVAS